MKAKNYLRCASQSPPPTLDAEDPITIEDAIVTLTDDVGNAYDISHDGNGIYQSVLLAEADHSYTLEVVSDGESYTATAFLPQQVLVNEVLAVYQEPFGPVEEGYQVRFKFNDPEGEANYYRIIHSIDGVAQIAGEDIQVLDDELFDGSEANFPVFRKTFDPGALIGIELRSMGSSGYDYYNSLADITAGDQGPAGGSAAPGNPLSNWSNNALGHFTAYSAHTASVQLPD